MFNLEIVKIDPNYCDYLRKFDSKIYYNKYQKENRPFIGVLFKIKNMNYFAPLSSPKAKHLVMKNTIDFIKIKNGELGAINFNNMIPVQASNYERIDLNSSNTLYANLLKEQLKWLNQNKIQIKKKAYNLYRLYKEDKLLADIRNRCCNFILLEEKCVLYNQNLIMN